jgi:hypothetical protein
MKVEMKMHIRLILLLLATFPCTCSLVGCGYLEDKEDLAKWVKRSMEEEIKKDDA